MILISFSKVASDFIKVVQEDMQVIENIRHYQCESCVKCEKKNIVKLVCNPMVATWKCLNGPEQ